MVKLFPFLKFTVGEKKIHSEIVSKKWAVSVDVESVVKVLSPKPVEKILN